MKQEKILIIGACGQIGVELTLALRKQYSNNQVIASDIREEHELLKGTGPYRVINATDIKAVAKAVQEEGITQIYLLAALLSASGEKVPMKAWDINMNSLLQILELGA
jgi:nucleoside-diphosphate-sugar epimerase